MEDCKTTEITITLSPKQAADETLILKELRKQKVLKDFPLNSFKILRRSIDARKKIIKVNLHILVSSCKEIKSEYAIKNYKMINPDALRVIIVGAGPAGLFAGLRAIELGMKPIIVERGKDVDARKLDIAAISRQGVIDSDSNYCFGEGGAGTFSDGKLYTRSKKRGNIKEVLEILHQFGASEDILINSHPHIGSDKLPVIIRNIRNKIIEMGGEVRFGTRMEEIILKNNKAVGIKTQNGEEITGPVFLAIGHSARDTYRMLNSKGVYMEPKGLAIGVRLEHPQTIIDKMQYHSEEGRGKYLPPAEYSFVDQVDGRGVYTFCMCPGGVIVPAVSGDNQIVVNGMSASARSGRWSNSGYVAEIHPGDIKELEGESPFEMLVLQENLEKKMSEESRGKLNAPAQKIKDFINGSVSDSLPSTSYAPGIHSTDFNQILPKEISVRLKEGLIKIGEKCRDFIQDEGLLIGLESRTSSPVRIPRNPASLQHIEIQDLYPMGEGAGYAGGIISSAIDGINCMDAYYLKKNGQDIKY